MTFKHRLPNAGLRPYAHEKDRARNDDEFSYSDYEQLLSDETYCQLAELRWLASELEKELARDDVLGGQRRPRRDLRRGGEHGCADHRSRRRVRGRKDGRASVGGVRGINSQADRTAGEVDWPQFLERTPASENGRRSTR